MYWKKINFENKANIKHNNFYDYSKVIYIDAKTKVLITCNLHGDFLQNPNNHLNGSGCPICGKLKNSENRTLSNKDFIEKAKKVHFDRYDYSKSVYTSMINNIIIICKIHGDFEQQAGNHLMGSGCLQCSNDKRKSNISEFITKANLIHNNIYDYNKSIYLGAENKLIISCKKHGDFRQTPASHLNGSGCPNCIKLTFNDFVEKSNILYNNLYTYNFDSYNTTKNKTTINCKIHGNFEQYPNNHLNGFGCPKCLKDKQIIENFDDFIKKANIVHDNKYHYHKVNYINSQTNIIIHCTEEDKNGLSHGDFEQQPNNHIQGKGCPKCALKYNIQESEVLDFIKSLNIENIITNDRTILNGKEIDIYLPDYNVAIEYNGLYWHSENHGKDNKYHLEKTELCLNKGIQLIHIFEDEWVYKKEIVKSRLRYQLNKIDKDHIAYGRNCFVKEINDKSITRNFLERNHIQGFVGSKVDLGLYININDKEYLLSIMTFGNLRKILGHSKEKNENIYELLRFCNVINYSVIGGASKLLKYFETHYKPEKIISYADRRWSKGNLYEQLNFSLSHKSKPNYFYINGLKRLSRVNFQKKILISKYGCSPEDTGRNFTKNVLGLNRIYDCGTLVYQK